MEFTSEEDEGIIIDSVLECCTKGDFVKAILLLEKLVKQNNSEALFLLGNILSDNLGEVLYEEDPKNLLEKSSSLGFMPALYKIRQYENKDVHFYWTNENSDSELEFNQKYNEEEVNKLYNLAMSGENVAMYDFANYILTPYYKGDKNIGYFWLERAAQKGNINAQYELGRLYLVGKYFDKDVLKASLWFERAAELGNIPAILELAKIYLSKKYDLYNPNEGVKLLNKIKQQNVNAMILLANLHHDGDVLEHNDELTKKYLNQAVQLGSFEASYELGKIFIEQNNFIEGVSLLDEAAKHNIVEAIYLLADIYYSGSGVPKFVDKAAFYYYKAACMGNTDAQYKFAKLCLKEKNEDAEKRAKYWLRKASDSGHLKSLCEYGKILKHLADLKTENTINKEQISVKWQEPNNDSYVDKYSLAFDYLLKAAIGGLDEAEFIVANMYKNGLGVHKDDTKYVYWCKKAATNGNLNAQFQMAELYNEGALIEPNLEQAKEWYISAALSGSVEAMYQLGMMYLEGRIGQKNESKALEFLIKSAEKNYSLALYQLGIIYKKGIGVEPNFEIAEDYLKKATKQKNENALIELINLYRDTFKVDNLNEAMQMLEQFAKEGKVNSMYELANCYLKGDGVETNITLGLKLLEKAALHKHTEALIKLGNFYFEGKYVSRNYQVALKRFMAAAKYNNSEALYKVGLCYKQGLGTLVNYKKALEYFEKSANKGYYLSYLALGQIYEKGEGVVGSQSKALYYYRLLAYSNYSDAYNLITNILLSGAEPFSSDCEEAARWLTKGVQQNNYECYYRLAKMHIDGMFSIADFNTGINLMTKAAEENNTNALYFLASAYKEGKIIQKNISKAINYCQKAASLNHIKATTMLGKMFYKGEDVEQNLVTAYDLFSTAAQNNDKEAQYYLALLYKDGDGVQQSYLDAYVWSVLALSENNNAIDIRNLRDFLIKNLTSTQLKKAQLLAIEKFNRLNVELSA